VPNINSGSNVINLYPNPTTAQLTLEMPTNTDGILTISSLNGQELVKQEVANTKTQLDVSKLQSGIYFVKVVNANGVGVKKFVKE
jgi:hypothetical protein